jgi:hypothetical protein
MKMYVVRWQLAALKKSGRMLVKAESAEAAATEALDQLRAAPVYMQYWQRAPFEIVWVRETTGVLAPNAEAGNG